MIATGPTLKAFYSRSLSSNGCNRAGRRGTNITRMQGSGCGESWNTRTGRGQDGVLSRKGGNPSLIKIILATRSLILNSKSEGCKFGHFICFDVEFIVKI